MSLFLDPESERGNAQFFVFFFLLSCLFGLVLFGLVGWFFVLF